jgi:PAS domain S-box-containing protein
MNGIEYIAGLDVVFDLSPDLLCFLDQNGCFLKANKFFTKALGYDECILLGRNICDFIHPEDREGSLKQIKALVKNEKVYLFKNRYRCASGNYKAFSWNAIQLPDKTIYCSGRDVTHYLKVQSQLAKALTDNQKIYDNSLDMLCMFNAEGEFTKISKAVKAILGYEEHELLGKKAIEIVHPDDVALTIAVIKDIKSGNSKTNFENRYIHKNGSVVPLIWAAQWLPLENSTFATARDATEREKQKVQLYFNERRLESLIESGNDCIGIIGIDGRCQYVSPSVKKLFHLEEADLVGKTPFDFLHPDDQEIIKNIIHYVSSTTDPVQSPPFRFRNGLGEYCWAETVVTNKLNDPSIQGIVFNSRDISIKIKDEEEKRVAAEKLQLSNERYELVGKATKDLIWDLNLETNQLNWNSAFEIHFGYLKASEIGGLDSWENHIHPDDKEYVLESLRNVIEDKDEMFWREEYRFFKADGSIAHIIDQGYVIRNADKKAIRMVGTMHDNTELKEKELHILGQNGKLREIAQINSHVIRRPVATILGLMGLLDKEAVNGEANLEILEHLLTATQELDVVIRHINNRAID